ncbi:hypothetical protein ILT44_26940 [Microvirga sp. BT689]|uniref:DUF6878 family protein n=1 Tax=Microvirga arvi TaxID=2778731 RepID=UPI00194FF121|nr:DUF6878 family protein [Microvirga arvi]MBM6583841.1 hypothetical protein [Microvirga arvi]
MKTNESGAVEGAQTEDLRTAILKRLTENDIAEAHIEFDGYGDEGQVQDISGTKADGTPGSLDWPCDIPGKVKQTVGGTPGGGTGTTGAMEESRSMTMRELLDDWAYELLESVGVDWINEDGGYGEVIIIPSEDVVRCEMNVRITDSEYSEHEL